MENKEVRIIPLSEVTDAEFAPYGQIMGRERGEPKSSKEFLKYWTRNVDLGLELDKVDCGLLVCNKEARRVRYFERHPETSENFVPIEGECIFVMAPADNSKSKPDTSRIKAFYLNGTFGVALHPGTWHWPPIPLGELIRLVLVRKGKIADPMEIVELKDLEINEIVLSFGK